MSLQRTTVVRFSTTPSFWLLTGALHEVWSDPLLSPALMVDGGRVVRLAVVIMTSSGVSMRAVH